MQLNELDRDDMGGQQSVILSKGASWKSRARWIKFEENWEEGADRWSKPHVASLTFNSLPQLRRGLENGEFWKDPRFNPKYDKFLDLCSLLAGVYLIWGLIGPLGR